MLRRTGGIILLATVFSAFLTVFATPTPKRGIKILVAIDILRPIVSSVTGSTGEVYSIVPSDVEPHGFSLTPSVVKDALEANLIVITGHMKWEADLVNRVAKEKGVRPDSISVDLLDIVSKKGTLLELEGAGHVHEEGERNIHGFWLMPDNALLVASALKDRLSTIRPEYSEEFSSNYLVLQSRVSSLKAFFNRLSEKYASSGKKVVIGFYAEQYVVETMGLRVGTVLVGEEGIVKPESLSRVYEGLKSGEYACIVISDTALLMSGVKEALQQISRETGGSIAYVSVVSTNGMEDYDSIMYYNAGQVYSALLSGRGPVSNGFNIYLLTTLAALVVIALETIILVRRSKA